MDQDFQYESTSTRGYLPNGVGVLIYSSLTRKPHLYGVGTTTTFKL